MFFFSMTGVVLSICRPRANHELPFTRPRTGPRKKFIHRVSYIGLISLFVCMRTTVESACFVNLHRLLPRAKREFCRHFLVDWKALLSSARRETKFRLEGDLHIYVVSLKRLRNRRRGTELSLKMQGVNWTIHEGIDGLSTLNMELVNKYAGAKKQKRMNPTLLFDQKTLLQLKHEYDRSRLSSRRLRQSLHERLRFGCFMSHVLLWQEVNILQLKFAIVLEDDALIENNFMKKVTSRLQKLPTSWDLLYLGGCFQRNGPTYDSGLLQSRGGLCTYGYVISEKAIRYLLHRVVLSSNKPIDHVLDEEISRGRLIAFHAYPPLVHNDPTKISTLAY